MCCLCSLSSLREICERIAIKVCPVAVGYVCTCVAYGVFCRHHIIREFETGSS